MNIRAKFRVNSITDMGYGDIVKFGAAYSNNTNSEDNSYAKATPSADLSMQIDNPDARGKFKVGNKYYVDFSEAVN
jgi:hypothetical protein